MKTFKLYAAMLSAVLTLGGTIATPEVAAQTKKGWSNKGKGAAVGAGTGAVAGAVIAGKGDRATGAVVGGAAGAVGGALIGRKKDKKKDPVRHQQYSKKN